MPLSRQFARATLRALGALLTVVAVSACVPDAQQGLLPSSRACLSADQVTDGDGDFRRHPELFGPERCVSQVTFREGGRDWTIQTVRNTARPGPLWVLPHDNEQAAVDTAAYALAQYGGTAVLVETGGRRTNGAIDPNRHFNGGRSRCAGPTASRYIAAMLGDRSRRAPVIALHTNAPGVAGRRGSGSISIRTPGKDGTAYPGNSPSGPLASPDSLVITAVSGKGKTDSRTAALVDALNAAGVNALVETTSAATTDCSLSHYAALNGIRPYVNIEVVDGDSATQRKPSTSS